MDAPTFAPTEEQEHGLHLAESTTDNIQFRSLAGTGKTEMLKMLQERLEPPIVALAFNSLAQKNMEKRFLPTTSCKTFNSFGLAAWNKAQNLFCIVEMEGNRVVKTYNLFQKEVSKLSKKVQDEAWEIYSDINRAVGMAKNVGYIPSGKYPNGKRLVGEEFFESLSEPLPVLGRQLVDDILTASIAAAYKGSIDFDDQIYMPALFGGKFPSVPNVLGDETQDLNPVNFEMLRLLKNSRLFTVGDHWQSIYAFRGAMQDGMNRQRDMFNMRTADLSVSFRCPEAIVRNAQWRAPNFKWIKPGGRVARLKNPSSTAFPDNCAIICRNNAPLFKLALYLLGHGRSVRVSGSDIGPRVIGLMKKLSKDGGMPRERVLAKIEEWRNERLSAGSTTADDTADCMRVFANTGRTLSEAISYANDLLKRDGTITLLTGHKSKGLEWETVYHLDPSLIKDDGDQELNLRYVIQTRSLNTYYEITTEEIRG